MIDPILTPGLSSVQPSAGIQAGSADDGASAARGARFQTLLEELDLRARAVAQSAQEPLSPESLPGAVAKARSSLEDALQLSHDLLEACRQSATQATAAKGPRA